MKRDKLLASQSKLCVCLSVVVAKLNFINFGRENSTTVPTSPRSKFLCGKSSSNATVSSKSIRFFCISSPFQHITGCQARNAFAVQDNPTAPNGRSSDVCRQLEIHAVTLPVNINFSQNRRFGCSCRFKQFFAQLGCVFNCYS